MFDGGRSKVVLQQEIIFEGFGLVWFFGKGLFAKVHVRKSGFYSVVTFCH